MGQRNSNSVSFPTPLEGSTSLHIISITRNSPILSKTWFHKVIKYIIEQSILLVLLPHPADKNLNSLIFRNFRIFFLILCQYTPLNYTVLPDVYTTKMCLLTLFFWTSLWSWSMQIITLTTIVSTLNPKAYSPISEETLVEECLLNSSSAGTHHVAGHCLSDTLTGSHTEPTNEFSPVSLTYFHDSQEITT